MLRSRFLAALATTGLVMLAGPLLAQDDATTKTTGATKPAVRANASARRVPPYFGQIGLTTEQREKIYTIRGEYQARIEELKQQIEELSNQEMEDCEAVLTEAQLRLLEARRATRKGAPAAPSRTIEAGPEN